jgi:hypothetical protein
VPIVTSSSLSTDIPPADRIAQVPRREEDRSHLLGGDDRVRLILTVTSDLPAAIASLVDQLASLPHVVGVTLGDPQSHGSEADDHGWNLGRLLPHRNADAEGHAGQSIASRLSPERGQAGRSDEVYETASMLILASKLRTS